MSEELEISFYDDNEYKSRRYPNLSGGQSDAAGAPDERDEKKNIDQARSEVAIHKKATQTREAIHGEHEPRASLPVLVNILNTNIEMLKTLKSVQDLMEYQIPLGQTHAILLAYKTGATFTHIDFADSTQTYGLPSGAVANEPNRKLQKLKIYNDGPGTIKISSNLPRSDTNAEIQLNAGEFDDSLSFIYNIIWSLNISVTGGAPTVRIFYVV
jgi:hypothetical protein